MLEARAVEEVSLGDFVLSGGEPAAIALIDACVRLLPGVIGDADGADEESFAEGLLEYPHYTRPQMWQGRAVPEVLVSGDHERSARWRRAQAERLTRERRPDLWQRYLRREPEATPATRRIGDEPVADARSRAGRRSSSPTRPVPRFQPGDTVRVSVKVVEGERERIQAFEGVCIARKNAGINSNFTLRKISYGEGVERIFPALFAAHHRDRGGAPRRRAPRQALLPARPHAARRRASPSAGATTPAANASRRPAQARNRRLTLRR